MSIRQLGKRAGLSKTAVASIEKNEVSRTARLESLDRLAEAMECEVVYAVVPKTSLDEVLNRQARHVAEELVTRVSDSMELEMQGTPDAERERLIDERAADLRRGSGKLWDV
jgi:predicted DNA-binding mobile mystery protein A